MSIVTKNYAQDGTEPLALYVTADNTGTELRKDFGQLAVIVEKVVQRDQI